jgi:hypothetical protein
MAETVVDVFLREVDGVLFRLFGSDQCGDIGAGFHSASQTPCGRTTLPQRTLQKQSSVSEVSPNNTVVILIPISSCQRRFSMPSQIIRGRVASCCFHG